ncbi:D-sedoheptulose 7-phosphate isomerase [Helicobacter cetorum]|uniref:Phosphoheptose isomerase n=1 Tax=Helicobacter cetorum (strain ATCC BAA-540 / CCUG 52418 / MIT 99-5656) TaxID=1163745 RepID=I0ER12_HELCM|nr:D-sedoheptulose 7-phosphate isomerase [Helicobacter cetorum]AFI05381.1 phosphoheptose isomerase [Helicobacter cetorum MIT 99-5656]
MINLIEQEFLAHKEALEKSLQSLQVTLTQSVHLLIETLENQGKILICGNGGSASDAQHFAAELTGRYKLERKGLSAISLNTDTSALTAIANDYGYEEVFSRQLEAIGTQKDVLIGISTSGNSKNILKAYEKAKDLGIKTLSLVGRDGGKMKALSDIALIVPSNDTPRIQEIHILIIHILCDCIERHFAVKS